MQIKFVIMFNRKQFKMYIITVAIQYKGFNAKLVV